MRRLLAFLALGWALCFAAWAQQGVPAKDAEAIRSVIGRQLEAFKRDDGAGAFALATEGIRAQFGSAETFMAMVRSSYPAVYRPKTIRFEKPEVVDGITVQAVTLTDEEGRAWMALYPMQREKAGWRINGCRLRRLSSQST